jgi:hypothetical protein
VVESSVPPLNKGKGIQNCIVFKGPRNYTASTTRKGVIIPTTLGFVIITAPNAEPKWK